MERERGQAGIETLIALPVLLLVALVGAQAVAWAVGAAARRQRRERGRPSARAWRPCDTAVRAELPAPLRRFTHVVAAAGRRARRACGFPRSCPGLPTFEVSARARP